tara:strand:- start:251 stop:691 length:441 start_codon:yes stop_codon:yes gene_type:complete
MAKFAKGTFEPTNPDKYAGAKKPFYRSSWELAFMNMCDNHPNITQWASENLKIPYRHPVTGKHTVYVPDFTVIYNDRDGKKHMEVIEIKPGSQSMMESARSSAEKLQVAINMAKWTAANEWCQRKGVRFRVLNENHIYMNTKKRKN